VERAVISSDLGAFILADGSIPVPAEKVLCESMSWERFYELSEKVAERVRASGFSPDVVVGIARGGWCLSRVLCDFLGVRDLLSLKVEHWGMTATPDGEAKIRYPFRTGLSGRRVLIVDDISDTGKSLTVATEYVKTMNPAEVRTATLLLLSGSAFKPDYHGDEVTWRWVVFPWNRVEDLCNLVPKVSAGRSPSEVSELMKETYSLDVDEAEVVKILEEVKRRKRG
jgi:hypothetical protein